MSDPDTSVILSLPYLLPSQAQKHVTHNAALRLLDMAVQTTVVMTTITSPIISWPRKKLFHTSAI